MALFTCTRPLGGHNGTCSPPLHRRELRARRWSAGGVACPRPEVRTTKGQSLLRQRQVGCNLMLTAPTPVQTQAARTAFIYWLLGGGTGTRGRPGGGGGGGKARAAGR